MSPHKPDHETPFLSDQATKASPLSTPILFLVFNRPEVTQKVFSEIRQARPQRLYVVADGPRPHVAEDPPRCQAVRGICTAIDWDCQIFTRFSDKNLGCKMAVSSGISWFFEQEEEGIILEDDCLPHPDFFNFCSTLLETYRHNERIMMISGDNFHFKRFGDGDYFFSRYPHIWGWATWKRAWQHYDLDMNAWSNPGHRRDLAQQFSWLAWRYWRQIFERVHRGQVNTWDYQWAHTCFTRQGLCITPNINLISNIGLQAQGTHTIDFLDPWMGRPTTCLPPILHHPSKIHRNRCADFYDQYWIADPPKIIWLWRILKGLGHDLIHGGPFKQDLKLISDKIKERVFGSERQRTLQR